MAGRQKHFEDAAELLYWFEDYLKEVCEKLGKSANLAGFARHCYCSKQTLLNYNVEGHPFFDAMRMIFTFLEDETINDAKMGDSFKRFYMTNTFRDDYKEKQEISSNNINVNFNDDISNMTEEEIDAELAKFKD